MNIKTTVSTQYHHITNRLLHAIILITTIASLPTYCSSFSMNDPKTAATAASTTTTINTPPNYKTLYPKTYRAPRVIPSLTSSSSNPPQNSNNDPTSHPPPTAFPIDGDITKPIWNNTPWSTPFDDIRGPNDAPSKSRPNPNTCQTRVKLLWDDHYLYILAHMTSHDRAVIRSYTKRNAPIYQQDSDFEVFLDPAGCNHRYKELEVNGYNTVWNLMLDKPYEDGGSEYSGREHGPKDGERYWDPFTSGNGQRTATKLLQGNWNDEKGAVWSVEMALPHADSLSRYEGLAFGDGDDDGKERWMPKVGMRWRMNFSRVEEKGEVNWTWSPEVVWDANMKRYVGKVAMHLPDAWGYLEFVDHGAAEDRVVGDGDRVVEVEEEYRRVEEEEVERSEIARDPSWLARLAAMNVYYAQHAYKDENADGLFASDLKDLTLFLDLDIVSQFHINIHTNDDLQSSAGHDEPTKPGFLVTVSSSKNANGTMKVSVTEDRFLTVDHGTK